MELRKSEELLIQAMRAMDEVPANILLWYTAGLEGSLGKIRNAGLEDYRKEDFERKIDISNEYQRKLSYWLTSEE